MVETSYIKYWHIHVPIHFIDFSRCSFFCSSLEKVYPYHFVTEQDLRHIAEDSSVTKKYPLLSHFAKNLNVLQAGGVLLPELIEFYLWIHQDLKFTLSDEDAKNKSLAEVIRDYADVHHRQLYAKTKGKFTQPKFLLQKNYCHQNY